MNRRAVWAIALKDIQAIRTNIQIWLPIVIIPTIFALVLPAGIILALTHWDIEAIGNVGVMLDTIEKLPSGALREALFGWETVEQQVAYFFLVYLFAPFFLLIPVMISSVVAANSFVGEKEGKTLESLLFTPLDMTSMFVGKLLSAFIPAQAVTVGCFILYSLVVNLVGLPLFGRAILPQLNWMALILWVVPAISLLAIFVNVYISARVKGFQEAYQLGGLMVLPILALIGGQIAGVLFLSVTVLFVIGLVVLLLDLVFIYWTGRHLDRNRLFESQVG